MKLKLHYACYELRRVKQERMQFPIQKELFDLLPDFTNGMVTMELARSMELSRLAEKGYVYEKFRPEIPPGKKGSDASGKLDLEGI